MSETIRIFVVDDHAMFRESLVRLLEGVPGFSVVAHCATLAEATRIIQALDADILLLDYDLGIEIGTDFLATLRELKKDLPVLMVTGGMRSTVVMEAIHAGISGVILKQSHPQQLIEAIRRVVAGETWWDTDVLRSLGKIGPDTAETVKALTERQQIVLRGILDGFTNKEIAAQIGASETSVKATIQELFSKAGVRTRSQLVRVAIERYSAEWLAYQQPPRPQVR